MKSIQRACLAVVVSLAMSASASANTQQNAGARITVAARRALRTRAVRARGPLGWLVDAGVKVRAAAANLHARRTVLRVGVRGLVAARAWADEATGLHVAALREENDALATVSGADLEALTQMWTSAHALVAAESLPPTLANTQAKYAEIVQAAATGAQNPALRHYGDALAKRLASGRRSSRAQDHLAYGDRYATPEQKQVADFVLARRAAAKARRDAR